MPSVAFRDICVSIISAALGPARPYQEFLAWQIDAEPSESRGRRGRARRVQIWLAKSGSGGTQCELWIVDPARAGPERRTIRDLPELHAVLGRAHDAAQGGVATGKPRGQRNEAVARSTPVPAALRKAWQALREFATGTKEMAAPRPAGDAPFRQRALAHLARKLGPYEEIPVRSGSLYRWVFIRKDGSRMHITLDSPEIPELAHLIVSDTRGNSANPIEGHTMRTLAEIDAAAEALQRQLAG